jgi:cyclic pyranopterin phosphate synthase
MKLSHVDEAGRARMVDVTEKPVTTRTARAEGRVWMSRDAFELVQAQSVAKGDVLTVAEVAGVLGAKRTGELIPLCHPLGLEHVAVEVHLTPEDLGVRVVATAKAVGRTGVEMEAMVKAIDRSMSIGDIRLLEKTGGTHGDWRRSVQAPETIGGGTS